MNDDERLSLSPSTPGRLAWALHQFQVELMARWTRRVLEDPEVPDANRLSRPALQDHIPDLVDKIQARLAHHPAAAWGERVGRQVGGSEVGTAHALHRLAHHYTLAEALRELSHFRAVILELCHENAVVITLEEAKLLHATIDEMMTTSARELERATVRKHEEAMAVVAHDLRNPLNTIAMHAARLEEGKNEDPRMVGAALTRSARGMRRLIEDLLTLSKIEAGHFAVDATVTDLRALVRETYEQFRPLAERRKVELVASIPNAEVLAVCDPDRILQALGNLVANALKFTPAGGRARIELHGAPDWCVLRVSDTGAGIHPDHLGDVFRLYWQAPDSSKNGAGLGLAIVRAIVEAHGGTIVVESTPGAGATFMFTLPCRGIPKSSVSLGAAQPIA